MHKFYYTKENNIYVMDTNHTLYRYTNCNNIQMILELENIQEQLIKDNNSKLKTITPIYNLLLQDPNIPDSVSMFVLNHIHLFQNLALPILVIELCLLDICNIKQNNKKKEQTLENEYIDNLEKTTLDEIKNKLTLLKEIKSFQKESVPLSEYDPTISKIEIEENMNILMELPNILDKIFEMIANIDTYNTFCTNIEIDNIFYTKLDIKNIQNLQKNRKLYQNKLAKEVQQKIDYEQITELKHIILNLMNFIPIASCLIEIITQKSIINISNNFKTGIYIGAATIELLLSYCLNTLDKNLKIMENPTLTLTKKEESK